MPSVARDAVVRRRVLSWCVCGKRSARKEVELLIAETWARAVSCLECPHCRQPLQLADGGVTCEAGHHFDLAREGYLNLLAGSRRRGELVGDSRAMLRARRTFLEGGYYDPIAQAVEDWVAAARGHGCVVDAGCGEGFYLGRVERRLVREDGADATLIGVDVAKDAVRFAARTYPGVAFVVGDIWAGLPLRDACADVVLSIFAPRTAAELARVTRPQGHVLVVIPTDEHLCGLREHVPLLRVEADKREHVVERLGGAFRLASVEPVHYQVTLDGPEAALLVRMGPAARHVTEEEIAALSARPAPITTAISMELLDFGRGT